LFKNAIETIGYIWLPKDEDTIKIASYYCKDRYPHISIFRPFVRTFTPREDVNHKIMSKDEVIYPQKKTRGVSHKKNKERCYWKFIQEQEDLFVISNIKYTDEILKLKIDDNCKIKKPIKGKNRFKWRVIPVLEVDNTFYFTITKPGRYLYLGQSVCVDDKKKSKMELYSTDINGKESHISLTDLSITYNLPTNLSLPSNESTGPIYDKAKSDSQSNIIDKAKSDSQSNISPGDSQTISNHPGGYKKVNNHWVSQTVVHPGGYKKVGTHWVSQAVGHPDGSQNVGHHPAVGHHPGSTQAVGHHPDGPQKVGGHHTWNPQAVGHRPGGPQPFIRKKTL